MKNLLIFIFIVIGCTPNIKNHEGYIYDYNTRKPLSDVEICLNHNNKNNKDYNCTKTNNKGFFKTDSINSSQYLYIYIDRKLSDSIQTVFTNGGEKYNEYFVNGRKDTAFIDMKQKTIIRQ